MDAIPVIGAQFQTFFPAALFLLCLVNYFDTWTKIVQSVGLEDLAFTEVFDEKRVEHGQKLFQIEKNRLDRGGVIQGQKSGNNQAKMAAYELTMKSSDENTDEDETTRLFP